MNKRLKHARHRFLKGYQNCKRYRGQSRQTISLVWLTAVLTFSIGVSQAQNQASGAKANDADNQQIALNLQDTDIRALINVVAETSGKNFIVDPRVKGKVSVISGAPLDPNELYNLFLSILEVHNFAAVETGNVIKVLPSNVIKQRPTPTLFSPRDNSNDEQITQIIQLNHAPVQDLVPIIRPLIPPTSHFAPHQPSNSVVVTDTAANIQRVLQIIRKLDIPDKRASIHLVNLQYAAANDLAATLTQLVTATADPQDAASSPKVSIQAYESTNSLLISAADEQFIRIQALIDELDVEVKSGGDVRVVALKHADAADLAGILRDLNANGGTAEAPGSEFLIQADEASNSLIIKASGNAFNSVESVIDSLDQRRAQVFVETIIAEVSLDQSEALGINWNAGLDVPTSGGTPAVIGDDGTETTAAVAGISNARANTVGSRAGTGQSAFGPSLETSAGGFTYSLLDFGRYNLDVTLNAIRNDTDSNIISTPTILTLDNEEAEIVIGQEVPFISGTFNNGLNNSTTADADGNQQVNTGTGFTTIERQDVGIVLRITPQINEGDTIQLEVFQEISDVDMASVGAFSDIATNRRSIEATVQVDDGQVIALGGLIQDDLEDLQVGVPFLSKIPILGNLFKSRSQSSRKTSLVVFLKPRIIRSPEDLVALSREKYEDVRRDSIEHRNRTDKSILLSDIQAPVLVDYDKATSELEVVTEDRYIRRNTEDPKLPIENKIKNIIFGRTSTEYKIKKLDEQKATQESEFRTEGSLDKIELDNPQEILQEEVLEPSAQQEVPLLDRDLSSEIEDLVPSEPIELEPFESNSRVLIEDADE